MSLIKVLVLGSTGMLGHRVMKVLSEKMLFAVCGTHISEPEDTYYFAVEEGTKNLT